MEFVGVLVFVTLVGMLFNAYFLILPSLEMKKHQIWICSAVSSYNHLLLVSFIPFSDSEHYLHIKYLCSM